MYNLQTDDFRGSSSDSIIRISQTTSYLDKSSNWLNLQPIRVLQTGCGRSIWCDHPIKKNMRRSSFASFLPAWSDNVKCRNGILALENKNKLIHRPLGGQTWQVNATAIIRISPYLLWQSRSTRQHPNEPQDRPEDLNKTRQISNKYYNSSGLSGLDMAECGRGD